MQGISGDGVGDGAGDNKGDKHYSTEFINILFISGTVEYELKKETKVFIEIKIIKKYFVLFYTTKENSSRTEHTLTL